MLEGTTEPLHFLGQSEGNASEGVLEAARSDRDTEDHKERIDRELIELLNELRVALPGVQVLFAFLLTLPFTQRFARLYESDVAAAVAGVVGAGTIVLWFAGPFVYRRTEPISTSD